MSGGKRFNEGKAPLALIPAAAEIAEARVWGYGAEKYGENFNWMKGGPALSFLQILNSMSRHVNAIKAGEDIDPETGEHHAASIRCNAAMLIQFYVDGRVEQDDRVKSKFKDAALSAPSPSNLEFRNFGPGSLMSMAVDQSAWSKEMANGKEEQDHG